MRAFGALFFFVLFFVYLHKRKKKKKKKKNVLTCFLSFILVLRCGGNDVHSVCNFFKQAKREMLKKSSKNTTPPPEAADPKMEQWKNFFKFHDKDGSGELQSHEFKGEGKKKRREGTEEIPFEREEDLFVSSVCLFACLTMSP